MVIVSHVTVIINSNVRVVATEDRQVIFVLLNGILYRIFPYLVLSLMSERKEECFGITKSLPMALPFHLSVASEYFTLVRLNKS